jgi:hypothetical protein
VISNEQGLQEEAVNCFQELYKAQPNLVISDQLAVLKNYPRMVSEEDNCRLYEPVTLVELLSTLKSLKVSKSLVLMDGLWSFFWLFLI